MRLHRPFTEQHWCESVVEPHWPFAYAKDLGQGVELKGRTASSLQNMGHVCATRGVHSKCHRCEIIDCEGEVDRCNYQIQGVEWDSLPKNVPTASDVPWAVGGAHRNDFGSVDMARTCLMLSGGSCVEPNAAGFDYRDCRVRCWGDGPVQAHVLPRLVFCLWCCSRKTSSRPPDPRDVF